MYIKQFQNISELFHYLFYTQTPFIMDELLHRSVEFSDKRLLNLNLRWPMYGSAKIVSIGGSWKTNAPKLPRCRGLISWDRGRWLDRPRRHVVTRVLRHSLSCPAMPHDNQLLRPIHPTPSLPQYRDGMGDTGPKIPLKRLSGSLLDCRRRTAVTRCRIMLNLMEY